MIMRGRRDECDKREKPKGKRKKRRAGKQKSGYYGCSAESKGAEW